MARPALSSRELCKALEALGATALPKKRGKGSHRMYERTVHGRVCRTPVPTGRGTVAPGTVNAIRRTLKLTPGDGISDEHFYGSS